MDDIINIQSKIYEIRGVRVMLDFDLAKLYQVETRSLKQAVRRNLDRFPEDFFFKLSKSETNMLIISGGSQIVIPYNYNPGGAEIFAFTEQGVAMLSSILRSKRAIEVSISIMRAFIAMRDYILKSNDLNKGIENLRQKIEILQRGQEENLKAVNDLSEEISKELDTIYEAIAVIVSKNGTKTNHNRIGYVQ